MIDKLIFEVDEKYEQYLSDESKMIGKADSISFPNNEQDIIQIVKEMSSNNIPITIQGGNTGIAGCAVPTRGHIMNLTNMNKVKEFIKKDEDYLLKVEPGITLLELNKEIVRLKEKVELFWPPNPTETSATVGGIASSNAKGICSYLYGDTRNYINAIRVITADGLVKEINRGESLIIYRGRQQDLIDVFLGGEGMFALISELSLKLIPKPKEMWGISFFFDNSTDVFTFVDEFINEDFTVSGADIAAVEYIDRNTINAIQERKQVMTKLKELPDVDEEVCAMIYIEIHGSNEEPIEQIAELLMEIAMKSNSDPDKAWAVSGDAEIEKMRAFRHAAAESANLFIEKVKQVEPRIMKLGTDMSGTNDNFKSVLTKYESDLVNEDLQSMIFGHVCGNHLHVNILPRDYTEYEKGKKLIEKWAKEITDKGGKFITEHGVGKLKKSIFLQMTNEAEISEIKRIKKQLDPLNIWNPNNMV